MKLFAVGYYKLSANPEDWSQWDTVGIVVAEDEASAAKLFGWAGACATEIDMSISREILTRYEVDDRDDYRDDD